MGVLKAPIKLTTPGYNEGKYPPPFHRYTWSVKIPEGETMELVFPDYDVVHYGSYNAVPECRSVVTVRAEEENARERVVIMRQKSPPYYASEGSQTTVNITLTTCNQDPLVPLGKGFKAYIRRTGKWLNPFKSSSMPTMQKVVESKKGMIFKQKRLMF